nr:MAG TPA: hypothetical protein [Bacteriophage sp.]
MHKLTILIRYCSQFIILSILFDVILLNSF